MKKKRIKKKRKLSILIFLIIVIVLAITAIAFSFRIKEIKVMSMRLEVSDRIGIAFDNETLNFGTVVRGIAGSTVTRNIELNSDEKCYGFILFKGELAKWVTVSERYWVIDGKKTITLKAKVPADAKFGNYKGKMIIILFH